MPERKNTSSVSHARKPYSLSTFHTPTLKFLMPKITSNLIQNWSLLKGGIPWKIRIRKRLFRFNFKHWLILISNSNQIWIKFWAKLYLHLINLERGRSILEWWKKSHAKILYAWRKVMAWREGSNSIWTLNFHSNSNLFELKFKPINF